MPFSMEGRSSVAMVTEGWKCTRRGKGGKKKKKNREEEEMQDENGRITEQNEDET